MPTEAEIHAGIHAYAEWSAPNAWDIQKHCAEDYRNRVVAVLKAAEAARAAEQGARRNEYKIMRDALLSEQDGMRAEARELQETKMPIDSGGLMGGKITGDPNAIKRLP